MAPNEQTVAGPMIDAATALLDSLDATQLQQATWPFDDDERRLWFYTPTDHGGLSLAEMGAKQHRLVWQLLATGLSEAAYNTTAVIVGQENVLDRVEGFGVDYGRDRGRDPTLYWVAVFGTPGLVGAWSWRFGGHHISLHFTMIDGVIVSTTPCFLGADPASAPLLGPHLHRPLAAVEDLGRELVHSFDDEQRAAAILASAPPSDLIAGNRSTLTDGDELLTLPFVWRGRFERELDDKLAEIQVAMDASLGVVPAELAGLSFTRRPKGLAAAAFSADQREILTALLMTYIGRVHDDLADSQAAKIAGSGLDELHFLWAGGLEVGEPHYYRVQGTTLFVEYDNAARNGNHVHTVWRDLTTDLGGDPLANHYTHGHHH